eukprot:TCONS_00002910-protein
MCKKWLPQHHLVIFFALPNQFSLTDITKIMLDLLRNPNYNRYTNYKTLAHHCNETNNKFKIFFWNIKKGPGEKQSEMFLNLYVLNFFTIIFPKADSFMVVQLGDNCIASSIGSSLFPNHTNYNADDRFIALRSHLYSSKTKAIHVNYEMKNSAFQRDEDIVRTENTVNIIVTTDPIKAPFLKNGEIIIHEEDLMSHHFLTLLIHRINFVLCHIK